jgi:hypothetical protein
MGAVMVTGVVDAEVISACVMKCAALPSPVSVSGTLSPVHVRRLPCWQVILRHRRAIAAKAVRSELGEEPVRRHNGPDAQRYPQSSPPAVLWFNRNGHLDKSAKIVSGGVRG